MSATNHTANYNLPQFIGSDKPAWLTDVNGAMSAIDLGIAAAQAKADGADTKADTVGANLETLSGSVTTLDTAVTTLSGTVTSQGGTINTITSLIGNGEPTTTDKTIIGAINELNGERDAEDIAYDNTTSGLTASNVQAAIDEVAAGAVTPEADDVAYDNTTSGLTATNVQAAIDELVAGGAGGGADLNFTVSGTATVTSAVGTVNSVSTSVKALLNASSSIGKIYGGIIINSVTVPAGASWNTVATISIPVLPTIAESYNIEFGYSTLINNATGYYAMPLTRMKFNTDKTIDVQVMASGFTTDNIFINLTPCIYILKDLGD